MSGSCGCAVSGSRRKMTASTSPATILAAICRSPPCGPLAARSRGTPSASAIRPPVVPVPISRSRPSSPAVLPSELEHVRLLLVVGDQRDDERRAARARFELRDLGHPFDATNRGREVGPRHMNILGTVG